MALRRLLRLPSAAPRPWIGNGIEVRRGICLIVDSSIIDSYNDETTDATAHALAVANGYDQTRYQVVMRKPEPDWFGGYLIPKEPAQFGFMAEIVPSGTYKPCRVDNELVNELCRLFKQGNVSSWEVEDVVRENGGTLSPYHVCEALKYYQDDPDLALAFFKWADIYKNYRHDQFSCNAILKVLGKHKRFDQIKMVLKGMDDQQIPMTYVTCRILLRIYVDSAMVEEALETFHHMENSDITPTIDDYNYMMYKLLKLNCQRIVPLVFRNMRSRKILPVTQSYNFLISSFCLQGKMEEAMMHFKHMKEFCTPDEYTYGFLINGYCKCMDSEKAVALLREMLSKGIAPNLPLFNMMMDCHARSKKQDMVISLFELMLKYRCKPDVKSYRVLVEAFAVTGRIEEAFDFLQRFAHTGYAPELGAYSTLMSRLGRANKAHLALEIYDKIKDRPGCRTDLVIYNIVLDLLGKVGRIQDCWDLYLKMRTCCTPDAFTFNTLIVRLGRAGKMELTILVLEDMNKDGLKPDHITYAGLIEGYARAGNLELAMSYLEDMRGSGYYPNPATLDVLVNALLKGGRFAAAELLVQELAARTTKKNLVAVPRKITE